MEDNICDFGQEMINKIKEDFKKNKEEKLPKFANLFKTTQENIEQLFGTNRLLFSISFNLIEKKLPEFINIFGDIEIIKQIMCNTDFDTNIFLYSPKNIKDKIENLCCILGWSKEKVFDYIKATNYLFVCSIDFLEKKIYQYLEFFDVSLQKFSSILYKNPLILNVGFEKLKMKTERFAEYLNTSYENILRLYVEYPRFILYGITELNKKINICRTKRDKLFEIVKEKPWIFELINLKTNYHFCGYEDFENLVQVCNFIEKQFGKVEEVLFFDNTDYYKKYLPQLRLLKIKSFQEENKYLYITIGNFDFSSKELMKKLFRHDYIDNNQEYVLYNKAKLGEFLKNRDFLINRRARVGHVYHNRKNFLITNCFTRYGYKETFTKMSSLETSLISFIKMNDSQIELYKKIENEFKSEIVLSEEEIEEIKNEVKGDDILVISFEESVDIAKRNKVDYEKIIKEIFTTEKDIVSAISNDLCDIKNN